MDYINFLASLHKQLAIRSALRSPIKDALSLTLMGLFRIASPNNQYRKSSVLANSDKARSLLGEVNDF
jgi:hypothetical protein